MRKEWKVFTEESNGVFNHDYDLERGNDGTLSLTRSNSGNWCHPGERAARLYDNGNGLRFISEGNTIDLDYSTALELMVLLKRKKKCLGKIKFYK